MIDFKANKINRYFLDMIQLLSLMPTDLEEFVENTNQNSVDELVKKIEDIDDKWEKTKKSVAALIKIVIDPEEIADDFEETERGIKF